MSLHYVPEIVAGVLISRRGEVHADRGRLTECGMTIHLGKVATVSHVQAIVFQLPLCHVCYPAHNRQGNHHVR